MREGGIRTKGERAHRGAVQMKLQDVQEVEDSNVRSIMMRRSWTMRKGKERERKGRRGQHANHLAGRMCGPRE